MTTGDTLRHWALALRALLEQTGSDEVTVRRGPTTYRYAMGEGLHVSIDVGEGRHPETVELPEEALDEERWAVAA